MTVNYNVPSGPLGKAGLGVGVDPETGHVVTDNKIQYSGTYKLKNTPDVSVGGPASGPCNGFSGGLGVSMPGMAVGANMSKVDKGCEARETARIAAMLGRMDIANAVLENIEIVSEALRLKTERDAKAHAEAAAAAMAAAEAAAQRQAAAPAPAPQPAVQIPALPPARTAPATWVAPPVGQPLHPAAPETTANLKEQQRLAAEALQRANTMWKVNDTLKFTDAKTQADEKTPQQLMAEEVAAKQAQAEKEKAERLASAAAAEVRRASDARQAVANTAPEARSEPIAAVAKPTPVARTDASAADLALKGVIEGFDPARQTEVVMPTNQPAAKKAGQQQQASAPESFGSQGALNSVVANNNVSPSAKPEAPKSAIADARTRALNLLSLEPRKGPSVSTPAQHANVALGAP